MKGTNFFQIFFIGACIILTMIGVFVFSFGGAKPKKDNYSGPAAVIWGTEDQRKIKDLINQINDPDPKIYASYVQKDAETFSIDLLEALALGKGPDVILVSNEDILSYQDKLDIIPFDFFSEREFRDAYIEEAEIFRTDGGFLAMPFSVDPLVLYFNRDIFTIHDKTKAPANWTTVLSLVPEMRDISEDLTVFESVISLGDYRNITNAKSILTALMLQSGTPITSINFDLKNENLRLDSKLGSQPSQQRTVVPAISALTFYTQFADPLSKVYSWNRALPNSIDMFTSDDLAMYIGFGSEVDLIRSKNPNLNFDMALLPQADSNSVPVTYGKLYGLALLSSSKNKTGALYAISGLSGFEFLESYAKVSKLPPVRRDLLSNIPGDLYSSVLYRSALYSRGFLDPNSSKTNSIFQSMVEDILAGRSSETESVQKGEQQFKLLIDEFNRKQEK